MGCKDLENRRTNIAARHKPAFDSVPGHHVDDLRGGGLDLGHGRKWVRCGTDVDGPRFPATACQFGLQQLRRVCEQINHVVTGIGWLRSDTAEGAALHTSSGDIDAQDVFVADGGTHMKNSTIALYVHDTRQRWGNGVL